MDEVEQNVSTSQDFTIPCKIARQSSSESEFKVTWFWQKGKESETQQSPIFTAYRNATLQVRHGKGDHLRFGHPLPEEFSLTVLKPSPEDSGVYHCEVEEWLPSLSHGWKQSAVKKSESLTVHVYTDGKQSVRFWAFFSFQITAVEIHVKSRVYVDTSNAFVCVSCRGSSLWAPV